ncbi:PilZ domain-containing protein [Treponema sp. TIM-1]|uniref:PilZ domain-containing protein n=1 Tax=Treponema sp. TIM-1 TaxID=2898417 RepID=UPI00397F62A2
MATPIKRIEKDFLLKTIYDEKLPIRYWYNRTEYVLTVDRPVKDALYLRPDHPVEGLRLKKKMDLMFDYRGRFVSFSVRVNTIKDNIIVTDVPEVLFRNLARSYSRVSTPQDLQIQLNFLGDRYVLSYPKISEYEPEGLSDFMQRVDIKNFSGLVMQLAQWIKKNANGYKLVLFKDVKPTTVEERLLAETGKAFFLPSTLSKLPQTDPYPKKRLITEEMFLRYLESTGVGENHLEEALDRFIRGKYEAGILSDVWIPILFQEYVIGYVHAWINSEGMPPFNFSIVTILYQFTSVFAFSLKVNGYFETGKLKNKSIDGKVIDISASGLLFAYPHSPLSAALLPDSELAIKLSVPNRTIQTNAKIVRQYRDNSMGYFGCRFLDMAPEDMRFLFEYIYGKPLTDADAAFLAGEV